MSFLGIVTGLTRPLLIFTLATVWLLLMYNCQSCAPNLSAVMSGAQGGAVAVLNHNRVMAYMVPTDVYEAMMERLDDMDLAELVKARSQETPIPVSLDDL